MRRLKASEYEELRELADEIAEACAAEPCLRWDPRRRAEPVAPTLARHLSMPDEHLARSREDLRAVGAAELGARRGAAASPEAVDLMKPTDTLADIVATLLYPVTDRPYRELYEMARSWSAARKERSHRRRATIQNQARRIAAKFPRRAVCVRHRHGHRRLSRSAPAPALPAVSPSLLRSAWVLRRRMRLSSAGSRAICTINCWSQACNVVTALPRARSAISASVRHASRFLFKMDFAEAEYIARLRSGVKGHFSYRKIAWEMKQKMSALEPELGA